MHLVDDGLSSVHALMQLREEWVKCGCPQNVDQAPAENNEPIFTPSLVTVWTEGLVTDIVTYPAVEAWPGPTPWIESMIH